MAFWKKLDYLLLCLVLLACVFGVVFIASATHSFASYKFVAIQLFGILLGFLGMFFLSRLRPAHLSSFAPYLYLLNIFILIMVLLVGTGAEETGNNSWIRFGAIGVQPSEFSKLLFMITFSLHLTHCSTNQNKLKNIVALGVHFCVLVGLIAMQGDLGTMLVFLFIALAMAFYAGISIWYFAGGITLLTFLAPFLWASALKPYHRSRIMVVLNPNYDPLGYGYQAAQCKTAIGSGELFGKGLFHGTFTQSSRIPAKHTDCIFAVIGEEGGLLCTVFLCVLLLIIILRCLYIITLCKSESDRLMGVGVVAMLAFQSTQNIGMCLGILPIIGITLPFISYGGSSIVSVLWSIGIMQSLYAHNKHLFFG